MSPTNATGERTLTELDHARLSRLASTRSDAQLADVLDEAQVVPSPAVHADVVTMHSRLIVQDLGLRRRQVLEVCYPPQADAASGRISVLSPAGRALIGLRVGDTASWQGPGGEAARVRIEQLLFQPEATGDYLT